MLVSTLDDTLFDPTSFPGRLVFNVITYGYSDCGVFFVGRKESVVSVNPLGGLNPTGFQLFEVCADQPEKNRLYSFSCVHRMSDKFNPDFFPFQLLYRLGEGWTLFTNNVGIKLTDYTTKKKDFWGMLREASKSMQAVLEGRTRHV